MRIARILSICLLGCMGVVAANAASASQLIALDLYGLFDDADDDGVATIKGIDQRSVGKQTADVIRAAAARGGLATGPVVAALRGTGNGNQSAHSNGANVQVNDPALDTIYSFPGFTRPFEESTQSETSIVRNGAHVIIGYNTSAGEPVVRIGNALFATQIMFSGFSVSHDGGQTFKSGFIPAPAGSVFTFGDPALAMDRNGIVYYSHLAADPSGNTVVGVSKSTDSGSTWSPTTIVFTDNGADKNWMAIGADPTAPGRDNLYVTWTRFTATGSQLILSRSIDGGATWSSRILFAPPGDAVMSSQIQFSNPVVDGTTGRLYIPFLHFSNFDADAVRVLVSDDGGVTFRFLAFNQPGAVDAFAYMNVTPGELADCGRNNGGLRNVIHQGADLGGGRFGLARYRFATRLVTQPAAAADRGRFFIALQSSTSPFFGDPSASSQIVALYSSDGGATWAAPIVVAPASVAEPQHVHPAVTLSQNGNRLNVAYYTQQGDSKVRTDVATLHVDGTALRLEGRGSLSAVSFDLTPSNNPFPVAGNPSFTTNYDRTVRACYDLGEYMSVTSGNDGKSVVAAWGDNRNTWIGPPDSVFPGLHAQADVFFSTIGK